MIELSLLNTLEAATIGGSVLTFGLVGQRQVRKDFRELRSFISTRFGKRSSSVVGINNISLQLGAVAGQAKGQMRAAKKIDQLGWLRGKLNRSGLENWSVFQALLALGAVLGAVLGFFSLFLTLELSILSALIAFVLVLDYLSGQEAKLQDKYAEQIRDYLLSLRRLLRSGRDLGMAFELASFDTPLPLGKHTASLASAVKNGGSPLEAMTTLVKNCGEPPAGLLLLDAIAAQQVGSAQLAPLFANIAKVIQADREFKAEVAADMKMARTVTKWLSFVSFAFPIGYRFVMPAAYYALVDSPFGPMIIAGAVLYLVGINVYVRSKQKMRGVL